MTRRTPVLLTGLAVSIAWWLAPSSATAQCRLCTTPTTQADARPAEGPISLQVEAALDFDQLILLGVGEGSAELRPDGSRNVSGMIGAISNRAMVGSATVRGEAGRTVRIDLPRHIELHSLSGGRVSVADIVSDLPSAPRLDSSGTLMFRFGGKIRISGDAEGDYRGEIQITAEYL